MPTGVGATTVVNDPSAGALDFITDPAAFFELTEKNVYVAHTIDSEGVAGGIINRELPNAGILAGIRILFEGTINHTIGTGTVTGAARYPHGLIRRLLLSVNAANDVYSVNGTDLAALRHINHPGITAEDDAATFPGTLGPGAVIPDGASDLVLMWDIPIAIDPVTLIGAIYAQSSSMNLQLRLEQAAFTTELAVIAGDAVIDSVTGTWSIQVTSFDIPLSPGESPALIVPDLSRLHAVQAHQVNFSALGEIRSELIRGNGQLDRLLLQYASGNPNTDTSADAWYRTDPDLDEVDAIRLEYGSAQRPLDYNPVGFLLAENIEDYDARLPYGYMVMDLLKENPPRDIIQMQGVTDLVAVSNLNTGAAAPAAGAHVRLVQEMLIG